jgi:curved DNA-binding protein
MQGGAVKTTAGGRKVRVHLPAGLREGDTVRVGPVLLPVSIAGDFTALVRGHDLWLTIRLPLNLLADGGRSVVDTPLGRKTLWVSRQAAERRLLRLPDQGLPARGPHPAGHLFLRLEADAAGRAESPARTLLRRFAAAWAA